MEVVRRVVAYKLFMDNLDWSKYDLHNCFAMDETAVFYGDYNRSTVDRQGATTVAIQDTGYASERVTCILGFRLTGEKLPPLVIAKGSPRNIESKYGIWVIYSEKAWSTQAVIRKYLEKVIPRIARNGQRGLLVWDAASTHRAIDMKRFVAQSQVDQIMIPSGTTMHLQSLDVAVNKPFKGFIRDEINEYTENRLRRNAKGNIIKPNLEEVCGWIKRAWDRITASTIENAICSCYLRPNQSFEDTHIAKDDRYGPLIANMLASNLIQAPNDIVVLEDNDIDVFPDPGNENNFS